MTKKINSIYEKAAEKIDDEKNKIDVDKEIDLKKPPGFVGEMAHWIENNSLFKRENLSVMSAISVASSVSSLRFTDDQGTIPNIMAFCVADSATGKEGIQTSHKELLIAAGLGECMYGGIKSSAEIVRNIITHQPCIYLIDEFGKKLEKIMRSEKGGGSDYLATVIAELMQIYSSCKSVYVLNGDDRKKVLSEIQKRKASVSKLVDKGNIDQEREAELIKYLDDQLNNFSQGVRAPLLTLTGYTTSQTFSHLMTHETVTSGFLGRCLLAVEKDSNPFPKEDYAPYDMPEHFGMVLKSASSLGDYNYSDEFRRIQFFGKREVIKYDDDAKKFRNETIKKFYNAAERDKNNESNLEAIARRSCEIMLKIALCIGAFEGKIDMETIQWAAKFASEDYNKKSIEVMGNSKTHGLRGRILRKLDKDDWTNYSLIKNSNRKEKEENIIKELRILKERKIILKRKIHHKYNKNEFVTQFKMK